MLKRLAFGLAVLAWWVPAQVFALGLGNIEMRSALNQPLDARIELLRAREGEVKDLAVALASADTFKRAGIERPAFLTQLKFEVMSNPGGTPYIQVRSVQPITEPFLNFLIEVNWPNGRLLREFTVLVDPPVLTDKPPAAVEAPATTASPEGILVDMVAAERARAEAAAGAQAPVETAAPSAAIEIPPPPAPDVAARSRAGLDAVTRAAPPSEDPAAEAVAALEREAGVRGSIVSPEPAAPESAIDAGAIPVEPPAPAPRREEPQRAKRDAIAVPEPERAAVSGEGVNYGPTRANDTLWEIAMKMKRGTGATVPQLMIALLENNPEAFVDNNINNLKRGAVLRLDDPGVALNISKEEAARIADLQWEQWKSQRGALVGSTPSRGVGRDRGEAPTEARVKLLAPDSDDAGSGAPAAAAASGAPAATRLRRELAAAEEALDAQRRATQDMRERVASLEEQLTTMKRLIQLKDDQLAAMQSQAAAPAAADAAAPAAAAAKTEDAAKPAAKAKPAEPPKASVASGLMSDPKLIGLVAVVGGVVVLLVWLFVRRRKMQQFQESILTLDEAASEPVSAQSRPASEDASFMSDFTVSSMEGIQPDVNDVDPLSEADVYLAYGRHKQAGELITQAIAKEPNRPELKMKLMEIHYAARDKNAFVNQAQQIQGEFSSHQPEMWARVMEMGRELAPDVALFGGAGAAPGGAGDQVEEFDLGDLNLGDVDAQPEANQDVSLDFDVSSAGDTVAAEADNSLDFDLGDFKLDDEPKAAAAKPAAKSEPAAADEHSLDFDLSAFDEKPEAAKDADAGLDFDLGDFDKNVAAAEPEAAVEEAAAGLDQNDDAGLDFKLDDIDVPAPKPAGNVVDFSKVASEAKMEADDVAVAEKDADGELDDALFADVDEVGTKLDLAKAYIDMGDSEGARSILDEVMEEGDDTQKQEAQVLMRQIG